MNEDSEAKYTKWGLVAGAGCVALFLTYAVGSGAMHGGSNRRACSTCRQAAAPSHFFSGGSSADANTK